MIRPLIITLICCCFYTNLKAQATANNYTPGMFVTNHELQYAGESFANQGIPKLKKKFSVSCHIFIDSATQTYQISEPEIEAAIIRLNQNFEPMGFNFEICEYDYITNFQYNNYKYKSKSLEPFVLYRKKNTINLYLSATSVGIGPTDGINGFASTPSDPHSFIYITKLALTSTQELTHLMGHFFGLYNTDEEMFGVGLVDGTNCRNTGDLMCDTRADLSTITQLSLFKEPAEQCSLRLGFKDPNGEYYLPPTSNFMSNYYRTGGSPDTQDCRTVFSPGQFRKMYLEVTNPTNTKLINLW